MTVTVVIATAYRSRELANCLKALLAGSRPPNEIVIVDGATDKTAEAVIAAYSTPHVPIRYRRHAPPSAAIQRNVGAQMVSSDLILFLDDDAYLEMDTLDNLAKIFERDRELRVGGAGVIIRNQLCAPPSRLAKWWLDRLSDSFEEDYSGRIVGPAIPIGPSPSPEDVVKRVEWLNAGCTMYRREAFPDEGFPSSFSGYSYMEDVDLSLRVGKAWTLVVHTGAFMFHDTRPSRFKAPYRRAKMSVTNRYYVMTCTLARRTWSYHVRFVLSALVDRVNGMRSVRTIHDLRDYVLGVAGTVVGLASVAAGQANPQSARRPS